METRKKNKKNKNKKNKKGRVVCVWPACGPACGVMGDSSDENQ
eukprot:SAG11_NODE_14499_length_610_cov_0.710372_1_plen_42_part_10